MALKRATDTVRLMRHDYVMCRRVHMFVVKRMTKVNAKLHVVKKKVEEEKKKVVGLW